MMTQFTLHTWQVLQGETSGVYLTGTSVTGVLKTGDITSHYIQSYSPDTGAYTDKNGNSFIIVEGQNATDVSETPWAALMAIKNAAAPAPGPEAPS